jgi:sulfur-carrier protein adenylyltransferase/sulfurtransferase
MKTVSPTDAKRWMEERDGVVLLDVREPWEYGITRLADAVNIPLRALQERLSELDPATPYLVYCHHGSRSLFACALMTHAGFSEVLNLHGGIDRWSLTLDPSVTRY